MNRYVSPPQPIGQDWLNQVFAAKAAKQGGIVKRKIRDVAREIGTDRFELEVRRRGFHLLKCDQHFIVICNSEPISILF